MCIGKEKLTLETELDNTQSARSLMKINLKTKKDSTDRCTDQLWLNHSISPCTSLYVSMHNNVIPHFYNAGGHSNSNGTVRNILGDN